MPKFEGAALAREWSTRLGLAQTPLLDPARDPEGQHFALFDGIEGSFALSTAKVEPTQGLDWTWSSQLANHVEVGDDTVLVRQVDPGAQVLQFERGAVGEHLDRFFETIVAKRVAPAITVVDHIVGCFRSHRHVTADAGLTLEEGLSSFLALLDDEILDLGHSANWEARLPDGHGNRLREELSYSQLTGRNADLALTMRHAAGMVFQETHAELSTEPLQPQLFGLPPAPRRSTRNRLGAYYTPPGLARTLADIAVKQHLHLPIIRVFDPTCGSGIFLCEVLRSLQRRGYDGRVELIGFDVSASAIEMARFALRHSDAPVTAEISVEARDFLTFKGLVDADIVLMNPPFVAFQDLSPVHQEMLREVLGDVFSYRPDFSVLFITLALMQLKQGGTLATLLPAGVLSQKSSSAWREQIIEANELDMIAVLGDHGLFRDAMVNIAALVLRKDRAREPTVPTMLWASQKPGASAGALRRLRRWADGDKSPERTSDWSIYPAVPDRILERADWLPRPNTLGDLPERLMRAPGMVKVAELFDVRQGIRPGGRGKFVISTDVLEELPDREKAFFRPIAEKGSIRGGRIHAVNHLFYPEKPMTVSQVKRKLPAFYRRVLSFENLDPNNSLELARARRDTMSLRGPRIVARVYVSTNSFAVDPDGSHVVVQGHSWLPRSLVLQAPFDILELLADYCFLLNSRLFFLLMRESGRIVGGGQVEAGKMHLKHVPLPDLSRLYLDDPDLKRQADELRDTDKREYPKLALLDRFAAAAYRTRIDEWQSVR